MGIEEKVFSLLQRKYALPKTDNIYEFNYVESGFIDSLEIIQFIYSIEEYFNIEFSDDEMAGDRIRTVGGIISLIKDKLA